MNQNFSEEDLLNIIREQNNQNPESNLEQELMNLILNPNEVSTTRIKLVETPVSGMLSEVREGVMLNPATGNIEKIQEQIIYFNSFDDGSTMNEFGILRCQNCGNLVREENTTRCLCGRIICISENCAKWSGLRNLFFCSKWHKFLGGTLGINLR